MEPIDFYWNLGGSGVRLLHILEPEKLTEGDTRKNFLAPLKGPEKHKTRKILVVPHNGTENFAAFTAEEGAGG